MNRLGSSLGLFLTTFSISAIISGVSLSRYFRASMFSKICEGLLAPMMALERLGFLMTHARANWPCLIPSLSAIGCRYTS